MQCQISEGRRNRQVLFPFSCYTLYGKERLVKPVLPNSSHKSTRISIVSRIRREISIFGRFSVVFGVCESRKGNNLSRNEQSKPRKAVRIFKICFFCLLHAELDGMALSIAKITQHTQNTTNTALTAPAAIGCASKAEEGARVVAVSLAAGAYDPLYARSELSRPLNPLPTLSPTLFGRLFRDAQRYPNIAEPKRNAQTAVAQAVWLSLLNAFGALGSPYRHLAILK